jgi:soluble lytic murein transglycosylase
MAESQRKTRSLVAWSMGEALKLGGAVMVALALLCHIHPALANEDEGPVVTASLSPDLVDGEEVAVPEVLSAEDVKRYIRIFQLQEDGNFAAADREIAKLGDKLLLGHVLAQRYLNSAAQATPTAIKSWLAAYGELPDAAAIKNITTKRPAKASKRVALPKAGYLHGYGNGSGIADEPGMSRPNKKARQTKSLRAQVHQHLRQGATKQVRALLLNDKTRQSMTRFEYDEARLALATSYFANGEDEAALEWAEGAAKSSGDRLPAAYWTAGLAAWRMERYEAAQRNFEALANTDASSDWMAAAGAFWAARVQLVTRNPEGMGQWLDIAAANPRTFYGMMASRLRGDKPQFDWKAPPFTEARRDLLLSRSGGKRALALVQVGQHERAEKELRKLHAGGASSDLVGAMLSLATKVNMPGLSLRLGNMVSDASGLPQDNAVYPVPRWEPTEGWSIDRALVYALIRQESGFNPNAKSGAGARGLMQVMPGTARFVAGKIDKEEMYSPELNLSLGQRYIQRLMEQGPTSNNLVFLAIAYNGGPGNMAKWERRSDHRDDPLLLIESLPSRETRSFVKRVLTNFWMYRDRLGQSNPSLDALAAGDWPLYVAQDGATPRVAQR